MAHTAFIKTGSLSLAALMLCACSSISQDGVVATDLSHSMSKMWSSVFTGELRRAPQPHYVFASSDATLNTPQLMRRVERQAAAPKYYNRNLVRMAPRPPQVMKAPKRISSEAPWFKRSFARHSLESYETYKPRKLAALPEIKALGATPLPPRSEPVLANPAIERDAYPAEASIEAPMIDYNKDQDWQTADQEIGDSLSYVKMGGGSQISDWQGCESEAGGYFLTTATGFVVAPEFDRCMRVKGYKPEAEAERELSASAG